jgi:hypothetical protein
MKGSERLKHFVDASSLGTLLKSQGFRVKRLNYCRAIGDTVQVVQFQPSQFSDAGSVDFTVNIGVALRPLWRVYEGTDLRREVSPANCFPGFRIGEAMAEFREKGWDRWWTVTAADAHPDVVIELREALGSLVVPLLNRLTQLEQIVVFVDNEAPLRYPAAATRIWWAILCDLSGQHARSVQLFEELEADKRLSEEWRRKIDQARKRLAERPMA